MSQSPQVPTSRGPLNAAFDNDPEGYQQLRDCWLNRRREAFLASELNGLAAGSRVLEIGCGTGWLLAHRAKASPHVEWVGVDPLESYISFARRNSPLPNLRFLTGTAESVDQLTEPGFHVILSNDMLHHVESQAEVAKSLRRLAAPGCRWLAIEPNCLNFYTFLRQALKHGERNFWPSEFLGHAHEAGWKQVAQRYLFLIPPFVKEPTSLAISLERRFEKWAPIAGGICVALTTA